jgi:hypothetical protein
MWRVERWVVDKPKGRWAVRADRVTEADAIRELTELYRQGKTGQAVNLQPTPGDWHRMWTTWATPFARERPL